MGNALLEIEVYLDLPEEVKENLKEVYRLDDDEAVEGMIEEGEVRLFTRKELINYLFDTPNETKRALGFLLSSHTDIWKDGLELILREEYSQVVTQLSKDLYFFCMA